MRLAEIQYTIHHIPGHLNVVADLLIRWGTSTTSRVRACVAKVPRRIISLAGVSDDDVYLQFLYDRIRPLHKPEFEWPTLQQISVAQTDAILSNPQAPLIHKLHLTDNIWTDSMGRVWLPDDAKLRTRVVVIAHTLSGHGSVQTTLDKIRRFYFAPDIKPLVTRYVHLCLHCDTGPKLIRRKYGEAYHATK